MVQNDMYVVMYKILSYIYGFMKRGVGPSGEEWDCDALGVPYPYWFRIVSELVGNGYLGGVEVRTSKMGAVISTRDPYVTMQGVALMEENSMMSKALAFLREIKPTVPMI